jgi:F-type H+-transporting ATPase subunit delta
MKLSREARRQSKDLFEMAHVDGRLDENRLRSIFDEIATKKPRNYIQMLKFLTRLVRLEASKYHAKIQSASPLTEVKAREIQASLTEKFGRITAEFHHTPDLIGGLRIQLGSNVWDGSIKSRLEAIKQS